MPPPAARSSRSSRAADAPAQADAAPAPASAAPRWRRRKAARPGEIARAALAVFAEKGFAAARVEDIAARAGLSKGALYLYYPTKTDLFRAVVSEVAGPALARLLRASAGAGAPGGFAGEMRALAAGVAALMQTTPLGAAAKTVIAESGNFPDLAAAWREGVAERTLDALAARVERAQAEGEVRPGDPRAFAVGLVAPMVMGVLWREVFVPVGGRPIPLGPLMAQHVETVLAGMRPAAPAKDAAP